MKRRLVLGLIGGSALALGLYPLAGWIGSSLPRDAVSAAPQPRPDDVAIMVETNGVHTALVVPLVTADKDWQAEFPAGDIAASGLPYSHLSISWGDKRVFLETETWADLRPETVAHLLVGSGEGLLHIAHYFQPQLSETMRPLRLSRAQYRIVVQRIEALIPPAPRQTYPGYAAHDVFYDARSAYTLIDNCNAWTGDTLAAAGLPMGRWTPFAGGVMKWVPKAAPQHSAANHRNAEHLKGIILSGKGQEIARTGPHQRPAQGG